MASGRINGSCSGTSGGKYDFWVEWSSSIDAASNSSTVSATAYLRRNDGYAGSAYNLNIPGSQKTITAYGSSASGSKGIDTRNGRIETIASISGVTVPHDTLGYATITISSAFPKVASSLTGGSLSKSVSLDHIDQAKPNFTSFNAYAISPTEIRTDWTADTDISGVYHSIDAAPWTEYDGKTITGLQPNTNYNIWVQIQKAGTEIFQQSPHVNVKTLPIKITSIGLQSEIALDVGKPIDAPLNIQPTDASIKELDYKFEPAGVCKITEDGKLLALKPGVVTVTASTKDGSELRETATITAIQRVEGIKITTKSISVPKGAAVIINYAVLPENASDKTVTITSDSKIVSINGNVATAMENGTATITVKTNDGGFTDSVTVSVIGDYVWYDYDEYIDILNYWDLLNIYSNMQTLYAMMKSKGYNVPALDVVSASFETQFFEVFDILQKMEYNLDKLNDTPLQSAYYIKPKKVGEIAENKAEIFRWIQCINDIYAMLKGDTGIWGTLLCIDGYPTINGSRLLVRGEIVNG